MLTEDKGNGVTSKSIDMIGCLVYIFERLIDLSHYHNIDSIPEDLNAHQWW